MSVDEIYEHTHIDRWFLSRVENIVRVENLVKDYNEGICPKPILKEAKQVGFSDRQIALLLGSSEDKIRRTRKNYGLSPVVKQIDTLAGEYPAQTNYLYLTYNGDQNDIKFKDEVGVIVLGSGTYRIGSSVEFDWCCVNAVKTVKERGYRSILINYNPETVSTDYDEVDRLYFDEISLENVLEIYEKESPKGVIVSMGGQVANNLALPLHKAGAIVLGTSPNQIDRAEDRHKFSSMLDGIDVDQPEWQELTSISEAKSFAQKVTYPVLVRPSYVLSGAAMGVANSDDELEKFLTKATQLNSDHPVVITKFLEDAKEIEVDAVARDGKVVQFAISEHVENAGVHSGDATIVLPPQRTYLETIRRVRKIAKKVAESLKITGPFNMQLLAKENAVKVIECNLRASRSFPFVSKVYKSNFIHLATKAILGEEIEPDERSFMELDYVGVKAPHFSFTRLQGADPTLGVEMSSTGEVGCLGDDFNEALLKSMISVGLKLPIKKVLVSSGPLEKKLNLLSSLKLLQENGVQFFATDGTHKFLVENGIEATKVLWPDEEGKNNVISVLADEGIDLVINIPKNFQAQEITNGYKIRRKAADFDIPLITNLQLAKRTIEAVCDKGLDELKTKAWGEYA